MRCDYSTGTYICTYTLLVLVLFVISWVACWSSPFLFLATGGGTSTSGRLASTSLILVCSSRWGKRPSVKRLGYDTVCCPSSSSSENSGYANGNVRKSGRKKLVFASCQLRSDSSVAQYGYRVRVQPAAAFGKNSMCARHA
jgi:hypothetical protein